MAVHYATHHEPRKTPWLPIDLLGFLACAAFAWHYTVRNLPAWATRSRA